MEIGEARVANCLVARVISSKAVNREVFRVQIPRIIQLTRKMEIEFAGDNTFIMVFTSQMDRKRVLNEGPWIFFRDLIVIKEIQGLEGPHSILYEEISIWVQCHNIPIAFLNQSILEKI